MKKALVLFAFASLIAAQSFASYIVVLKGGKQYKAKAKWTVVNGKALIQLENGQSITIDPALIDEAKSEETTKLGLGNVRIMNIRPDLAAPTAAPKQQAPTQQTAPAVAPAPVSNSAISTEVIMKFERAYENVGIFEHKLTPSGAHSIRAEVTADSEDKVFNAISATSFLMVRNAGVAGAQVDMVELFMKTTNGGAAGRFQMTREDAQALDAKAMSLQEYFVRKVLY
jgi:hypothetical protein